MFLKNSVYKQKWRILILDDNTQIKASFRQSIDNHFPNSFVLDCSSEHELKQLLDAHHFDLLILDSRLHGMSAPELIRQIKVSQPGIKIISMYANAQDPFKDLMLNAGADGLISKFEVKSRNMKKEIKRVLL